MIRKIITAVLVLAALAAGGLYWQNRSTASAIASQTQYKLATVESGEVKKTVSATGTLQPWRVVDVKARAGGELIYLPVEVGSTVKAGQIIARIDKSDSQMSLSTSEADLNSARKRAEQSERTHDLQIQQSAIAIRDAKASLQASEASVKSAQARLATAQLQAKTQPSIYKAALASAQASLSQAKEQLAQLQASRSQQIAAAQAAYDQAVANRDNNKYQLARQKSLLEKGFVSQQTVDTAQATLAVNEAQVTSAKARLESIAAELDANIDAAKARIAQSDAALSQTKTGEADIKNRQNAVLEAEAALKQAIAQRERAKVTLSQAQANQMQNQIRGLDVAVNAASIARAEASFKNAKETYNRTEIAAPMDGVVLSKDVEKGTIIASAMSFSAQGTRLLQIGDVSQMYVDVTVDETDIANVNDGAPVDVTVDAYPGQIFEGKVLRIDPQAVVVQNVTTVHVRVQVDNSSQMFQLLKPGMNATCEFVLEKKENVVTVPGEAIHQDDSGDYVEVGSGGKPAPPDPKTGTPAEDGALVGVKIQKVPVKKGVEGNDAVEITEGLKGGEQIVVQTIEPQTATAASSSPFGGGRMGGFGGGGGRR